MDLVNKMNETDTVAKYCETFDDVIDQLSVTLSQSDIIVIMGAGNVTNISKKLFNYQRCYLIMKAFGLLASLDIEEAL